MIKRYFLSTLEKNLKVTDKLNCGNEEKVMVRHDYWTHNGAIPETGNYERSRGSAQSILNMVGLSGS